MCVNTHMHMCVRKTVVEIGKNAPEKTLQIVCKAVCHKTGNTLINMFFPVFPLDSEVFKLNPSGE